MRLWHYKLIPFLPKSQLIAQWRELNSIFVKQDRHILINYVYEYPKTNLYDYSLRVLEEMASRRYSIKSFDNLEAYFGHLLFLEHHIPNPFPKHHDFAYLRQCFYNLEEKYQRGQKDFSDSDYERLARFYDAECIKLKGESEL